MDAINECIKLMIERIRSKNGANERFNLYEFKSLETIQERLEYADRRLQKLGEGSSRVAYTLSSRFAMKIASNELGLIQNEEEVAIYKNASSLLKSIITKIHKYDEQKYTWIIADLVRPFKSDKELNIAATGHDDERTRLITLKDITNEYITNKSPELLQKLYKLRKNNEITFDDIDGYMQWGKAADGRIVLVDYGYSQRTDDAYERCMPSTDRVPSTNVCVDARYI
jgi:hypothetical protein